MARFCFAKRPLNCCTLSDNPHTWLTMSASTCPLTVDLLYDCHPILCTCLHGYLPCSPTPYYGCLLVLSVILGYNMLRFLSSFIVNNEVCQCAFCLPSQCCFSLCYPFAFKVSFLLRWYLSSCLAFDFVRHLRLVPADAFLYHAGTLLSLPHFVLILFFILILVKASSLCSLWHACIAVDVPLLI